jgi:hypothetical protein
MILIKPVLHLDAAGSVDRTLNAVRTASTSATGSAMCSVETAGVVKAPLVAGTPTALQPDSQLEQKRKHNPQRHQSKAGQDRLALQDRQPKMDRDRLALQDRRGWIEIVMRCRIAARGWIEIVMRCRIATRGWIMIASRSWIAVPTRIAGRNRCRSIMRSSVATRISIVMRSRLGATGGMEVPRVAGMSHAAEEDMRRRCAPDPATNEIQTRCEL